MYTQCPDCEIAFKITADVLKQAAGKVRCGGCGNAFNALSYLSEQMPKQPVAKEANAALPELRPEIIETDSCPPHAISAEQSAALLKTLDELAGSDIRIEDTGVEWRVLDEQEAAAPAAATNMRLENALLIIALVCVRGIHIDIMRSLMMALKHLIHPIIPLGAPTHCNESIILQIAL